MMRGIGYRAAATVFVFAGLWFVLGLLMLASPIPHALGIGSEMFVAWLLLFLAILAMAGGSLTMAAINGLFPPSEMPRAARRRAERASREPVAAGYASPHHDDNATHDAQGRPLPWTQSPLPPRPARRAVSPRPRGIDPRQGH
jgi:hypothetical protein